MNESINMIHSIPVIKERPKMQEQNGKIFKMNKMKNKSKRPDVKNKGAGSPNMNEIIVKFSSYLKAHNIQFRQNMTDDGIPQITMLFQNCDMCPEEVTEGCIFFYDDVMEARVYYSEFGAEMCRTSEKRPELYRFMNFLQARIWPRVADGMDGRLYSSQYLFYPRFYVTEDEMYDITATMCVPYTYYELDELETEDFITAALPDLMNRLSVPIFFILLDKITADEAIEMVEKDLLSFSPIIKPEV